MLEKRIGVFSRCLGWACFPLALAFSCAEKEDGASPFPDVPPADSAVFDVEWKPSTVVLEEDLVRETLENPDSKDGIYRFEAGVPEIEGLMAGRYLLLSGVGLFEVLSVDGSEDETAVSTRPAALIDAATRGTVAWSFTLRGGESTAYPVLLEAVEREPTKNLDKMNAQAETARAPGATFSGTLGKFSVDGEITPADSRTDIKMKAVLQPTSAADAKLELGADGWVGDLTTTGRFEFENGVVRGYSQNADAISIEMTLTYMAANIAGDTSFRVPAVLAFPFAVGPIPMFVALSGAFEVQASLGATGKVSGRAVFKSASGFETKVENQSPAVDGQLDSSDNAITAADHTGAISTGFGVVLDFPRLDLGVGLPSTMTAESATSMSVYGRMRHELVTNATVETDLLTGEDRVCLEKDINMGGYVGGEIRLFAFSMNAERQIFAVTYDCAPEGDGCDE